MSFLLRCLRDVRQCSGDLDLLPPATRSWDSDEAAPDTVSSRHEVSTEAGRDMNRMRSSAANDGSCRVE